MIVCDYVNTSGTSRSSTADNEAAIEQELLDATNPDSIKVEKAYKGPHIQLPICKAHIDSLIQHFKANKVSRCRVTSVIPSFF